MLFHYVFNFSEKKKKKPQKKKHVFKLSSFSTSFKITYKTVAPRYNDTICF